MGNSVSAADANRDFSKLLRDVRNGESLAAYYLRTHRHLVPTGVEFWEYDALVKTAARIDQSDVSTM